MSARGRIENPSYVLRAFVLALALVQTAQACTIPVFRYALDRWPADRYRLEVAGADAKEPQVARYRRNFTDSTPVNLSIANLAAENGETSRLLFPHSEAAAAPAWSGPLDGAVLGTLTDSPARKTLVQEILQGASCVWVLVESGDAKTDGEAAKVLAKRLSYLEQVTQIPPIDPNDPSSQLGPGPALVVKFATLRVRGDDPAEQPFLTMLAGPKGRSPLGAGPWLATVFGRGRVLGAWPAAGFGDEQIDEVSLFLLGACSCQVKRENPGWDLLLDADWDTELQAMGVPSTEPAPASGPALPQPNPEVPPPALETVTILPAPAPSAAAKVASTENGPGKSTLAGAAGALLALGVVLTWWTMKKPS